MGKILIAILAWAVSSTLAYGVLRDNSYRFEVYLVHKYPTVNYEAKSRSNINSSWYGIDLCAFIPVIGPTVTVLTTYGNLYDAVPYHPRLRFRGIDPADFAWVPDPYANSADVNGVTVNGDK